MDRRTELDSNLRIHPIDRSIGKLSLPYRIALSLDCAILALSSPPPILVLLPFWFSVRRRERKEAYVELDTAGLVADVLLDHVDSENRLGTRVRDGLRARLNRELVLDVAERADLQERPQHE